MLVLSSTLSKLSAPFSSLPEGCKRRRKQRYYPPGGLTECIPQSISAFSIPPDDPILRAAEASLRARKGNVAATQFAHHIARDFDQVASSEATAEAAGTAPCAPDPSTKMNDDHGASVGFDVDANTQYAPRRTIFRGRSSVDVLGYPDDDDSHGRSCAALPRFDRRPRSRSVSASPGNLSRSLSFATPQFRRPFSFISASAAKASLLAQKRPRTVRRCTWPVVLLAQDHNPRNDLIGAQPNSSGVLTFQSRYSSRYFPDICSPVTPAHLGKTLAPLASERLRQELRDQGYLRAHDDSPENTVSVFGYMRRTLNCCFLAPTDSTDGLRIDDTQRSTVPRRPFSDSPLGRRIGRMVAYEMIENAHAPSMTSFVFHASDSGFENENVGIPLELATAMEDEDESPSVMVTRTSSRDFQTQTVFYSCSDYATMSSRAVAPPAASSRGTHLAQLPSRGDESWVTAFSSPPRPHVAPSAGNILLRHE
ncbi:hypothetical protein CONPUDRAFT_159193 [Coniophora puteana RWD-64-598 SS2]|uniref:Uncharacterized protein n=1 Tax=Coniophora puteana (strain RWD-64-598) TaxID=741705 RepID=A0A5M3M7P0_CONPW|nr:uncharacterized protein CONPUDRAFT_159193 [Coniophora puteana RWD-64-598 SS2]EIW75057.1 hypothetical protein CONPUDRAFT_159193 [Coniophora puteana RWD-64-598 SS2]